MGNMITFKEVKFSYIEKPIFTNFNLTIKTGLFTTIIGDNGSGKTTLVKILLGLLPYQGTILVDGLLVNKENIKEIRKNVGVIFENPDSQFIMDTVYEELAFLLESLNYNQKEIKTKINLITKQLGITHLLPFNPYTLSGGEKQLVLFAIALIKEPKILILDEAMTMLDPNNKLKIYSLLKKLKDNTTIINICHELEDALNGEEIIILDDGVVVAEGKTEKVLSNIKNLKKIGIEPPFMLELSDKLKYYELITKPIYSIEKMVDKLWP